MHKTTNTKLLTKPPIGRPYVPLSMSEIFRRQACEYKAIGLLFCPLSNFADYTVRAYDPGWNG